jgi:hypothetical protein
MKGLIIGLTRTSIHIHLTVICARLRSAQALKSLNSMPLGSSTLLKAFNPDE